MVLAALVALRRSGSPGGNAPLEWSPVDLLLPALLLLFSIFMFAAGLAGVNVLDAIPSLPDLHRSAIRRTPGVFMVVFTTTIWVAASFIYEMRTRSYIRRWCSQYGYRLLRYEYVWPWNNPRGMAALRFGRTVSVELEGPDRRRRSGWLRFGGQPWTIRENWREVDIIWADEQIMDSTRPS